MKLDEWLYQKRIKRSHFAREHGISIGYMSDLCQGKRTPSLALALKLMDATEGNVTPSDYAKTEIAA